MHAEEFRASRSDHEPFVRQSVIFYDVESIDEIESFQSRDRFPIPSEGEKIDFRELGLQRSADGDHIQLDDEAVSLPEGESVTYEVKEVKHQYTRVEPEEDLKFVYEPGFAVTIFFGVSEVEEDS